MNVVILGLSITSSWGNGHATTYRALAKGLQAGGHRVRFIERDEPWHAEHRDLAHPPYCCVTLYESVGELERLHAETLQQADLIIVGSYVPQGAEVIRTVFRHARGVTAFYDIDTPVTVRALRDGDATFLDARQVADFDIYLSFTGGPMLECLEREFSARRARPLYCSVDPFEYAPRPDDSRDFDLGYLGTYSADRQATVDEFIVRPAREWTAGRFIIAGAQYPPSLRTPPNVERIEHLPPTAHRAFYNRVRFALNVTRKDMIAAGYSPSVRLFEAAACGTPIITDNWPGLANFFSPYRDILIATDARDVLSYIRELSEEERLAIGARARRRVLDAHTSIHRAIELEQYVAEVKKAAPGSDRMSPPVAAGV